MNLPTEKAKNVKKLIDLRENPDTPPAVCIQAIQTMEKIFDNLGASASVNGPTEEEIMKKIRAANRRKGTKKT